MYSLLSTLFVIGVFLVVVGFLGRVGTDSISDESENVAVVAFLDTVILSTTIEIIMLLPLTQEV